LRYLISILTTLLVISGVNLKLYSQYFGGQSSKDYSVSVLSLSLPCPVNLSLPYTGGVDDGYSRMPYTNSVMYKGGQTAAYYTASVKVPASCIVYSSDIYKGGIDSGVYSKTVKVPASCSHIFAVSNIYNGGFGGGFHEAVQNSVSTVCPFTIASSDIYKGGDKGGFSEQQINAATACASFGLASDIYKGGSGSGFSEVVNLSTSATCSFTLVSSDIYKGGSTSGFSEAVHNTVLPGGCYIVANTDMYYGGASGVYYTAKVLTPSSCQLSLNLPYTGGVDDGANRASYSNVVMYKGGVAGASYSDSIKVAATCNQFASYIYTGGNSGASYTNNVINLTGSCPVIFAVSAIYTGGSGSGFSEVEKININTSCLFSLAVSDIYKGGSKGGFSEVEVISPFVCSFVLAVSDIYKGGGKSGHSEAQSLSNFTCSTPSVASNIYTGGNKSGFVESIISISSVPAVSISANSAVICAGEQVDFLSVTAGGGSAPSYQWLINGSPVGGNNSVFSSQTLNNGDVVSLEITSSLPCSYPVNAISNTVSVTVNPAVSNNSITQSQTVCPNAVPALLSGSSPIGGNSSYTYNWEVSPDNINWSPAPGINNQIDYDPSSITSDSYVKRVVSSSACASSLNSNSILLEFAPLPVEITSVSGNSGACYITSVNDWIYIPDQDNKLLVALFDSTGGNDLLNTTASVIIDNSVQSLNGAYYLQRHFSINPSGPGTAKVRLYFTQTELNNLMAADISLTSHHQLTVTKFSGPGMTGGVWIIPDTVIQDSPFTDVYTVEIPVSSFSDFYIHKNNNGALPIQLLSFDAECSGDSALISWVTASETNNDFFNVERSPDLISWQTVKTISGAGNSNSNKYYNVVDRSPYAPAYYRLKQTDFNGQFSYSNTVVTNCETVRPDEINVYPNPATGNYITVEIISSVDRKAIVGISSVIGGSLINKSHNLKYGVNKITMPINGLASGVYILFTRDEYGLNLKKEFLIIK